MNKLNYFFKIIAIILLLVFCYLVYASYNRESAIFIIEIVIQERKGFFFEKTLKTFHGFMLLIYFQLFVSYIFLIFEIKLTRKTVKMVAFISIVFCIVVYFYSGVFPIRIPTIVE